MPGFGRDPTRPNGMWGVTRPARPTDTGDGPASASGAGVASATPGRYAAPKEAWHAKCTGAVSTGARGWRWAGTPTKHTRPWMRILRTRCDHWIIEFYSKSGLRGGIGPNTKAARARAFHGIISVKKWRLQTPFLTGIRLLPRMPHEGEHTPAHMRYVRARVHAK